VIVGQNCFTGFDNGHSAAFKLLAIMTVGNFPRKGEVTLRKAIKANA
jgi:hypothetical protein